MIKKSRHRFTNYEERCVEDINRKIFGWTLPIPGGGEHCMEF